MNKDKLILIDGSNLMFRAFHAVGTRFITKDEVIVHTGAMKGMYNNISLPSNSTFRIIGDEIFINTKSNT